MKRIFLAGAAVLALSLGTAACGSVNPDAMVVNGTHTTVRDLEHTLTLLKSAGAADLADANGSFKADTVRQVLGNMIVMTLFHQEFVNRKLQLEPTAADESAGIPPQIFAADAGSWAKLPESIRTEWAAKAAEYITVRNALANVTDEQISAFYDANKDQMNGQTLDQMHAQIKGYLQGQSADYNTALGQILQSAKVTINKRYGTWDPNKGIVPLVDTAGSPTSAAATTGTTAASAAAEATTTSAP